MTNQLNRLATETSPYLLQHANNPVEWHPWCNEAITKAQRENKPILLSIGYAACHWCHVMAHESFEEAETAALMNQYFINIKVDREERPDLDKIYQMANHILNKGMSGWPLTLFLTPDDLIPFYSGTYFPPVARFGLPGFKQLLPKIGEFYHQNHKQIHIETQQLKTALQHLSETPTDPKEPISDAPLREAREELQQRYDQTFSGFDQSPKFPHPGNLEFLIDCHFSPILSDRADKDALAMVTNTLDKMALGGIYDHLGGWVFPLLD